MMPAHFNQTFLDVCDFVKNMRKANTWVRLSKMQSRGKAKFGDKGLQAPDSLLKDQGTFKPILASRFPLGRPKLFISLDSW